MTDLEFALLARVLGTSQDEILPEPTWEAAVKDFLDGQAVMKYDQLLPAKAAYVQCLPDLVSGF